MAVFHLVWLMSGYSSANTFAGAADRKRDAEIAAQTGQPIRADLQRARQIIVEDGFSGLLAALKRGVALPAAAFAPLVELLREQEAPSPVE